uniref:Nucleos_tra2_N domain-containing protein n=1 Tax=Heterorhabditis bacteriophora TaxID=37862 RepID=A0A1I7WRB5_HETBA
MSIRASGVEIREWIIINLRKRWTFENQNRIDTLLGNNILILVTWMNFFSLSKFAARFQIVATVAKLLSCFLIIVTGFYYYYVKGEHTLRLIITIISLYYSVPVCIIDCFP